MGVTASRRFRLSRRRRPADCFDCAYEAVRIAIKYMTPVILLTDGQLANGAEPWLLPDVEQAAARSRLSSAPTPNGFMPYMRDPETLSRPWAVPGTPGLEHRIGGLSSEDLTGNISYSPANNELMVRHAGAQDRGHRARNSADRNLRRRGRRRPGGARMGLHLRLDSRGGQAAARQGQERLAYPSALSESAAERPRRATCASSRR